MVVVVALMLPTPSAASTPNIPSVPPSFNVVGGGATNQLAEAIGWTISTTSTSVCCG